MATSWQVEMLLRLAAKGELTLSRGTIEELGSVLAELTAAKTISTAKRKARS